MIEEYNYLFKNIVVGDGGCGKTALVVRFSQGYFLEQYKLTIGVEFAVKTISIKDGIKVKLQIWDTGGQERFQYVRPLYYRGAMGAILLFDLTNRESFDHIPKWIEEVKSNAGEIPMLLVGNKSDLTSERSVSREEAETFAREFQLYYIESSAKDGTGVGDVFAILSCLMVGTPVPDEYLQGIILTDTMGRKMGKAALPPPEIPVPMPAPSLTFSFAQTPEPMEFVEIPTPPPKEDLNIPSIPRKQEEWEVPSPSRPTTVPTTISQDIGPSKEEIEASIPPVPKKPISFDSGPIVFDTPVPVKPTTEKVSAPPPLVFQPGAEAPIEKPKFTPSPTTQSWTPSNAKPTAAPILFPKAKPAAAPAGFQPKSSAVSEKTPFTADTGLEQVSSTKAIDNLLGALTSKPQSSSTFKKTSKPSMFIPEVKVESKNIEPVPLTESEKKKKEKKLWGKKREKSSIVICSTCGAILSANYKFCNKCGSPVKQ